MTVANKPQPEPGRDDALDELTPAERRRIDKMPPLKRARHLRNHHRAVERRRARRAAMQQRQKVTGDRISPSLSLRAGALSAEATTLALSDDAIRASAGNAVLAARLVQVVARSRDLAQRALDMEWQEITSTAITASMERIDPAEFQRRVQIRRRMSAVKAKRRGRRQ